MRRGRPPAVAGLLLFVSAIPQLPASGSTPTPAPPAPGSAAWTAPVHDAGSGSWHLNVSAPSYQAGTNAVQLLLPDGNSAARPTVAIVLALPVEAGGTATAEYGGAIDLVRSAGWHSRHNVAVVTPAFSTTPWFGDRSPSPSGSGSPAVRQEAGAGAGHRGGAWSSGGRRDAAPVRQEAYILEVIVPWLIGGGARSAGFHLGGNISLVGFSKSGWGAFSLLARNPAVFERAALWDAPTMLSGDFCDWLSTSRSVLDSSGPDTDPLAAAAAAGKDLWDMLAVFGSCAGWRAYAPVEIVRGGLVPSALRGGRRRLWLGGQCVSVLIPPPSLALPPICRSLVAGLTRHAAWQALLWRLAHNQANRRRRRPRSAVQPHARLSRAADPARRGPCLRR